MTISIQIKKTPEFKDAKWSKLSAKPGDEVELQVTAKNLLADQSIHFQIRDKSDQILANIDAGKKDKKKWVVPFSHKNMKYHFLAILRDKPGAENGHRNTVGNPIKSKQELDVKGTKITVTKIDKAFVPKQEKLEVKYKIDGEAPAKGRIEIWGERYPTDKPVYFEKFTPKAEEKKWDTWKGGKDPDDTSKGNIPDEPLKDKYLTPEFSPYRVRIIIGEEDKYIEDPYGEGLGKVAVAESQFEVKFQSINVRVHEGLNESAAADKHKLKNVLAVEKDPLADDGTFLAKGRLPTATEHGRIRLPMANHWATGQDYDQGGIELGDAYTALKKFDNDELYYTRPEIAIEFQLRLSSRVANNNTDERKKGLFEPDAIGPAKIEPYIEDYYNTDLYEGGDATNQTFWKNADHKIKKGRHSRPRNSGNPDHAPVFDFWQARFVVANDGDQEFDVSTFDATFSFNKDENELVVYLNRTKLELDDNNDANAFNKDYKELDDEKKIKLRPGLTKANDVLWIVRGHHSPGEAVPTWKNFPQGTNCQVKYGGIRGTSPFDLFRDEFSGNPGGVREPVTGRTDDDYPYKEDNHINLEPNPDIDDADNKQERVEVQAMLTGGKKGLAGIIFRSSYMAGDSYVIHAEADHSPYARNFGFVTRTKRHHYKTGDLTVWRVMHIHKSIRLPDRNTVGLGADAGSEEVDDPLSGRTHPGNGRNMLMSDMNDYLKLAFNEWTMDDPVRVIGASNDDPVRITTYQNHGLATGDQVKIVDIPGNNAAEGDFVVTRVDDTHFDLHAEYDFDEANGVGDGVDGSGGGAFPDAVNISGATNEAPITITTAADHNLANDNEVVITGVGGNDAANGVFTVQVTGARTFTLDDSNGEPSGNYTNGGTVQRCGKIDVHRGCDLFAYKNAYFNANVWTDAAIRRGRVRMDNPTHIQDEFAAFDHYRWSLPRLVPNSGRRRRLYSNVIATLDPGTSSLRARNRVRNRWNTWHGTPPPRPAIPVPASPIPRYAGSEDDYYEEVETVTDNLSGQILNVLTPLAAPQPPKSMPAVRWPRFYHHRVWTNARNWNTSDTYTEGFCSGGGQSFFQSHDLSDTLFTHEMGHSCHLSHFVGDPYAVDNPDLCWKHHDLNSHDCLMSYDYTRGYIPKPVGAEGPNGGDKDTGWPDRVPNPKPTWDDNSASILQAAAAGDRTIEFTTPRVVGGPCAKCVLKLRGWDEEVLPCAWRHPDLF